MFDKRKRFVEEIDFSLYIWNFSKLRDETL